MVDRDDGASPLEKIDRVYAQAYLSAYPLSPPPGPVGRHTIAHRAALTAVYESVVSWSDGARPEPEPYRDLSPEEDALARRLQKMAEAWRGGTGGIYTIRAMCCEVARALAPEVRSRNTLTRDEPRLSIEGAERASQAWLLRRQAEDLEHRAVEAERSLALALDRASFLEKEAGQHLERIRFLEDCLATATRRAELVEKSLERALIMLEVADSRVTEATAAVQAAAGDRDLLDALEKATRMSRTGISFDWVPSCDGERSGFRFMRQFFIGTQCDTLRDAVRAARDGVAQVEADEAASRRVEKLDVGLGEGSPQADAGICADLLRRYRLARRDYGPESEEAVTARQHLYDLEELARALVAAAPEEDTVVPVEPKPEPALRGWAAAGRTIGEVYAGPVPGGAAVGQDPASPPEDSAGSSPPRH